MKTPALKPTTGRKTGEAPGTLTYVGRKKLRDARITLTEYGPDSLHTAPWTTRRDFVRFRKRLREAAVPDRAPVTWLNVDGVHKPEVVASVGNVFDLHPLLQEDVVDTEQKPKVDFYDGNVFVTMKLLHFRDDHLLSENVSLVLGHDWVVSFHEEREEDLFEPVRRRLAAGRGQIRTSGADYLFYALVDMVVDHYFVTLAEVGDRIEQLELDIMGGKDDNAIQVLYRLKREMIVLRRSVWPVREILSKLQRAGTFAGEGPADGEERTGTPLIRDTLQPYLRDVYDHTIQVIETVESYRDILSGLLDVYLSLNSNRMNEIMKVLTVISTIFIPLTFLAGVYGMNFHHMPELDQRWAYPALWGVMLLTGGALLLYFRRKGWL
ncbi:MAG: magnesium/cobalt transporter CorA [Catalinimonas sp.]